jgi:hypothetical protein
VHKALLVPKDLKELKAQVGALVRKAHRESKVFRERKVLKVHRVLEVCRV